MENKLFTAKVFDGLSDPVKTFLTDNKMEIQYADNLDKFQDGTQIRNRTVPRTGEYPEYNVLGKQLLESCKEGIGEMFFDETMEVVWDDFVDDRTNDHRHEILVLTRATVGVGNNIAREVDTRNQIGGEIVGFLVVQYGECMLYPTIPALKLICSSGGAECSRMLMYIYVYALKAASHERGLLELAGAYDNLPGLCLYNKFGFIESAVLEDEMCFNEGLASNGGTLGMMVMVDTVSFEALEGALIRNIGVDVGGNPLCNKAVDTGKPGSGPQLKLVKSLMANKKYLNKVIRNSRNPTDQRVGTILGNLFKHNDIEVDALELFRTEKEKNPNISNNKLFKFIVTKSAHELWSLKQKTLVMKLDDGTTTPPTPRKTRSATRQTQPMSTRRRRRTRGRTRRRARTRRRV